MGCRRLTMQEYEDITSSNPDRIGYDTQADFPGLPNGGTHHPGKFCEEVCPT